MSDDDKAKQIYERLHASGLWDRYQSSVLSYIKENLVKKDVYEGYDPEARAYFEALDYGVHPLDKDVREYVENSAVGASPEPLPPAFAIKKPSWIERLLRKLG